MDSSQHYTILPFLAMRSLRRAQYCVPASWPKLGRVVPSGAHSKPRFSLSPGLVVLGFNGRNPPSWHPTRLSLRILLAGVTVGGGPLSILPGMTTVPRMGLPELSSKLSASPSRVELLILLTSRHRFEHTARHYILVCSPLLGLWVASIGYHSEDASIK